MLDYALRINPFDPLGMVLVESVVLQRISAFRQRRAHDSEAGGILLGYRRGAHLHVTDATRPQPHDKRSRFQFERRDAFHQAYALDRWRESRGALDHIGEWHSHPESSPMPSSLDRSEWRKICAARVDLMVFMILGDRTEDWLGVGSAVDARKCLDLSCRDDDQREA